MVGCPRPTPPKPGSIRAVAVTYLNMAETLLSAGNYREARRAIQAALDTIPIEESTTAGKPGEER